MEIDRVYGEVKQITLGGKGPPAGSGRRPARVCYGDRVFRWLTDRRRTKLLEQPFAPSWEANLEANVSYWQRLDGDARDRLRELIVVFVAEKTWEGCGGLAMTDEIRVTVAAQACILLLGREHALYADVDSILVYPSTVISPARPQGVFVSGAQIIREGGTPILGEAHLGGPVLLAWDDVLAGGHGGGRRNVVFHEFAHKIDMLDGASDGTPPLADRAARHEWTRICSEVVLGLRARVEAGEPSFLDDYGATNEAEFFAVATEAFWCQPRALARKQPELFELLHGFYQFDPPPDPG